MIKQYIRCARIRRAADLTGQDYSAGVALNWTAVDFDTDAMWNSSANPNRLTTPATAIGLGFSRCRLEAGVFFNNMTAASNPVISIRRNGTAIAYKTGHNPGASWADTITTGIIAFVPGDYFDVSFQCTDTSIDFMAARSFFSIELLA